MNQKDIEIEKNKEEVVNIINKVLDKGANYVIRSMPINKHIKDILIDVKKVIKEKDFSQILKVALTSSLNEGMEAIGIEDKELQEIKKMMNTALNGGLPNAINIGLDIISSGKKYGNIFYNYIDDFFYKLKGFVSSADFKKKMYAGVEKSLDKVDDFKELCNDWYDAYDSFDMNNIKGIAKKLNGMKSKVSFNNDCVNENSIIQNITELVDNKKEKLSKSQFQICSNFYEL